MEISGNQWDYPLVNVYRTMEIHHVFVGRPTISMAMFNSYVSLPEGITVYEHLLESPMGKALRTPHGE